MRARTMQWFAAAGLLAVSLSGCNENNLFSGFADDNSTQAKIEGAQRALDKGDCVTAINGFSEVLNADPGNVDLTVNLSAALMCRAGFSVTQFIAIAADMATSGSGVTQANVFDMIATNAVTALNPNWPGDTTTAINLLSPYSADTDVAFNLAIYEMIQAVMTVADILNLVNGGVNCGTPQGSPNFTDCNISIADALAIETALQNSSTLLTSLGLTPDVTNTVNTILTDMNAASPLDPISCADIQQYLFIQNVDPNSQLACL